MKKADDADLAPQHYRTRTCTRREIPVRSARFARGWHRRGWTSLMFGRNKTKAVDVRAAHDMAQNEGWVLLDVRTKRERTEGHPSGSIHYSLDSLEQRLEKLEGQKVLAICESGNRSAQAARFLQHNDIETLNVKGGMIAWRRAGLPTKTGN